jgi:hypothetical protein
METNDILNRIKLMMNYDSKKTLTENRLLINEETSAEIIQKLLDGGALVDGTNEGELEKAIIMIQRTVKSWSDFQKLDTEIKNGTGKALQELLNNELGYRDTATVKVIVDSLNQIPGLSASYKTNKDKYGKSYYANNSITITQKSGGENTNSVDKIRADAEKARAKYEAGSGLGNKITDYPICVQERAKISKSIPTASKSGQWSVDIGGIYYYSNGRTYNPTTKESGDYHCGGPEGGVITPGKSTGKEGSSGNSKSGNKTPYNWKGSPAVADVQSGKATIVYGMSGDSVIEIQRLLNSSGAKLREDGKFGGGTYRALTNFQKKSGTTNQKGVVDADTYNKLKGGGGTDEFATTDVEGKFGDSQSSTPVSQLVMPKSGEGTPEPQSAGEFT